MLSRFFAKRLVCKLNSSSEFCNVTRHYISIPEFYRGKSVLITGATGFLGQGLVEKLLRSCPDIGNIYVSVRPDKSGKTGQKFRNFLQNEIFQVLRENDPSFATKIIPFRGDITQEKMGMDKNAMSRICEDVSVIFHCAADIRLNPSLRVSIEGNVLGSKNVYEFGKKCPNLCAYVHVSTAYSNYDLDHVEEKIYPASSTPDELIGLAENQDDDYFRKHTRGIVNTPLRYTFCKKVAENVLVDDDISGKTAVFRSCFITPSMSEPFPYWMFGQAGYVLILNNVNKGELRYVHGVPDNPIEMVPVDMIVNSLINVGWYLGTGRHSHTSKDGHTSPLVINVNSSTDNAITLRDLERAIETLYERDENVGFRVISNKYIHFLMVVAPTFLRAAVKDIPAVMKGEQPMNITRITRHLKAMKYLETTTSRHPTYDFNNAKLVHDQLSEADKQMFPFDVKSINWESYLSEWIMTLKEPTQTVRTKDENQQTEEDAIDIIEYANDNKEGAVGITEDAITAPIREKITLRN